MTLSAGPLLPILVDPSVQVLELEEIDGLQANTPFFLEITAVNINGERALNDRFIFSKKHRRKYGYLLSNVLTPLECSKIP